MSSLRQTLAHLVSIDSSSHLTNAPVITWLARQVESLGFTARRFDYTDAAGIPKHNLVAVTEDRSPPALALVGHTDTVPFDPAWQSALRLEEREGLLYGRGTADTKGFIACALEAAARIDRSKLRQPLALVFTADEEVGCIGARKLVAARALSPARAIIGEPTGLTPVRAHKGYSLAEVEVIGREGHSAHPHSGASAILRAAELVGRIEDLGRTLEKETAPEFEPPWTTLNIGRIHGGTAANIIPGRCTFTLEWRSIPGQAPERVLDVVHAAAQDIAARHGIEVRIGEVRSEPGVSTPASAPLVRFLEDRTGRPPITVPFATEAPQLAELGAEVVVFGPGDIKVAHRTGEHVPAAELERCAQVLAEAIEHFCG
jgi:acetylornithine deacetylase